MKYKYVPDSYDMEALEKKNISYNEFLNMQVKYRQSFEKLLKKYLNFKQLDTILNKIGFEIPTIQDIDYNFYHKFSTLNSNYFFLRNNIHIENLSADEMQTLMSLLLDNTEIDEQFILKTFQKVLFEDVASTFYGIPVDTNLVSGKTLIFEFAYNEQKCSLEQSKEINQLYLKLKIAIENVLKKCINCPIDFIINDGFENIYMPVENDEP